MCNLCILKTIRYINCSLPTYKRTQKPPFPLWHHTGRAAPMQVRLTCSFSSTVLVVVVAVGHFIVTYNFYILRIGHCCYGALATFAFAQTHTHTQRDRELLSVLCGMARDANDATEFNARWIRTWEQQEHEQEPLVGLALRATRQK